MSHAEPEVLVEQEEETARDAIDKILIIVSKANIDSVYAALILAHGARWEGIETDLFFTLLGIDAIAKTRMDDLSAAISGNPGLDLPETVPAIPGAGGFATNLMRTEIARLGIPTVSQYLNTIKDAGGYIYACNSAMEKLGLSRDDLWDGVKDVMTMDAYYRHATERSQIIVF